MRQVATRTLRVRLSEYQWRKLEAFAARQGRTKSGVIHEYLRRLPAPESIQLTSADDLINEYEVATGEGSTPLPAE